MKDTRSFAVLTVLLILPAAARAQATLYQGGKRQSYKFTLEGLTRQEWNEDQPSFQEASRWRFQLRPRLALGVNRFVVGVGGDFNYSEDKNTEPPPGNPVLPLIRDNYKSRDARLDLAFLSIRPATWLQLQGGRLEMPVGFTEMIWDRDLRPQGGALALEVHDGKGEKRFGLTGLWARGSHVFDDGKTSMLVASAEAVFSSAARSRLTLTGSFVKFTKLNELAPQIHRQNTRVAGLLVRDYGVVDVVARWRTEGKVTTQLVADYAWNTSPDDLNKGLWLALILGSTKTARGRLEYTYAKLDRDVTLAAYAGDDFFWGTGWEGHRVDLGVRASSNSSFHVIGEQARFKDSPNLAERDLWSKRVRLELRFE